MTSSVGRGLQALCVAGLITVVAPIAGSAASQSEVAFADPAGDATGGAADILNASIADNGRGRITFAFDVANRPRGFKSDDFVHIFLDTDENAATGNEGDDYAIQADANDETVGLFKWDGTAWTFVPTTTLGATDAQRIWINVRELGSTAGLRASFETLLHSDGAAYDTAGPINFSVSSGPSGPPELSAVSLTTRPSVPRAGKQLLVELVAQRDDTGDVVGHGTVRCSAKIGSKTVKTTWPGHFFEVIGGAGFGLQSSALCSWNVPRGTRGRTIKGSITIVSDGLRLREPFAFHIR
jgi:hypothetical protein